MVSAQKELYYREIFVIVYTYIAYSGLNACRKAFAYAKDTMNDEWDMNEYWQGIFDGTLMFSYAIGLYISGRIGDKFNPSICLGYGLFFTGFLNSLIIPTSNNKNQIEKYTFLWKILTFYKTRYDTF